MSSLMAIDDSCAVFQSSIKILRNQLVLIMEMKFETRKVYSQVSNNYHAHIFPDCTPLIIKGSCRMSQGLLVPVISMVCGPLHCCRAQRQHVWRGKHYTSKTTSQSTRPRLSTASLQTSRRQDCWPCESVLQACFAPMLCTVRDCFTAQSIFVSRDQRTCQTQRWSAPRYMPSWNSRTRKTKQSHPTHNNAVPVALSCTSTP